MRHNTGTKHAYERASFLISRLKISIFGSKLGKDPLQPASGNEVIACYIKAVGCNLTTPKILVTHPI